MPNDQDAKKKYQTGKTCLRKGHVATQSFKSTSIIREVGVRIRNAREELGLSQSELSVKLEMSRVSISQIENGRRKQVKPELICKIAKALDKPETYFYSVEPDKETLLPLTSQVDLSHPLEDTFQKLRSLPRPQQEKLGRIIEELLTWYEPETVT
jgi:transcriptional regulator with XRE-family HTH domain